MSGRSFALGRVSAPGPFVGAWMRRLVVLVGVVTATLAIAADDSRIIFPSGGTKSAAPAAGGTGTANLVTLVVALVIGGIGAWYFWRNRKAGAMTRQGHALAIDETRSLGNRQYLVVASYEGKKFLLGVCPGRIDLLAPLNERARNEDLSR